MTVNERGCLEAVRRSREPAGKQASTQEPPKQKKKALWAPANYLKRSQERKEGRKAGRKEGRKEGKKQERAKKKKNGPKKEKRKKTKTQDRNNAVSALPHAFSVPNNSATGTRTRVARVRAEYPNQLDYSGVADASHRLYIRGPRIFQV